MQIPIRKYLVLASFPAVAAASLISAFLLRFEFVIHATEWQLFVAGLPFFIAAKVIGFYLFGAHRSSWRTVGVYDLVRMAAANFAGSALASICTVLVVGPTFPRSIYILDGILCFLMTAALQFSERLFAEVLVNEAHVKSKGKPILIYGAGAAGLTLAKEIRSNPRLGTKVAGFLDDDSAKRGTALAGVRILGDGREAARIVTRLERRGNPIAEIVIAMPSADGRQMRTAIGNCRAAGKPFKTVPGLGELLNGKVLTSQIRDVSVDDLLGREPVRIDETAIAEDIAGKSVLVTGGAGSIGSELCRQLARFNPGKLVLFDQAESEMFMLGLELGRRFPDLQTALALGDICDRKRVDEVMSQHAIQSVFHAAAYKHVPMMEANVLEAASNNVIGTYNVAQSAYEHKLAKFVMISSDKAVNPTSIMGVTKRIAELLASAMPLDGCAKTTAFVSVRFGNVLGSKGSVVPIFQQQIAAGGPILITHPDMRRYFMTIREAVQLVLQASVLGRRSEIFVLDMGEPVKILDLAKNMVRLAGLVPDEDIEIRFTGLRPGEKLFEELRTDHDSNLATYHPKIKIFESSGVDRKKLAEWLGELNVVVRARDWAETRRLLLRLVPEYRGESAMVPRQPGSLAATHADV